MIVATRPLVDCCPVVPAAMEGRQMVMWDKDSCSDAGFLKIDLLGLGMLSAVERCVELVAARRGERIDLSRIPYDDPATFEAIQEAETTGVFQIESRAQMGSLRRTRPENLDDLTIQVAIVRPGPIQGGAVNPYIERRQRLRVDPDYEVPYDHPSLEPVLRDTLGTIIFQDQVIEVAMAFAGFSPGEAEGLRRAMSRKRSAEAIEAHHRGFVEGAMAQVARRRRGAGRARVVDGRRLLGLRLPQGPRRRLRPARLPVDLAARPLRARVPVLAARRAADGLLPARRPRPRGPAPRHRDPAARTSTPARSAAPSSTSPPRSCPSGPARLATRPRGRPRPRRRVARCSRAPTLRASSARTPRSRSPRPRRSPRADAAAPARAAVRLGLGYVLGVRGDEVAALVAAREAGGPFRSLDDLAARAGAGRPGPGPAGVVGRLRRRWPAVAGRRCGAWASRRRAHAAGAGGTQLSLGLELPAAPALAPLEDWDAMIADYATTGLTVDRHPLRLLRPGLTERGGSSPAPTSATCPTARTCGSAASSSRASGRGPPRASSSSCSRTRPAR